MRIRCFELNLKPSWGHDDELHRGECWQVGRGEHAAFVSLADEWRRLGEAVRVDYVSVVYDAASATAIHDLDLECLAIDIDARRSSV
jgi:hypothetical protein